MVGGESPKSPLASLISPQGDGYLISTLQGSPYGLHFDCEWWPHLLYGNQSLDPTFSFVFYILACEWRGEGTLLQLLGSQKLGSPLGFADQSRVGANILFCVFFKEIILFLTALDLHCCAWAFSSCLKRTAIF